MTKRVLFTGAGGFIGRQAVPYLLERGYEVHAVDIRPLVLEGCQVHTANLLNESDAKRVIESVRPTHLLHMAWYVEHGKFWTSLDNTRWVEASLGLLREFMRVEDSASMTNGTCSEYETGHAICLEDDTPCRPATLYGACKYALSVMQSALCRQAGISHAWPRIFFLYGPGEPERKLVLVGNRVLIKRRERPRQRTARRFVIFCMSKMSRERSSAVLDSPVEGNVNIGSGEPVSQKHVVETIARLIGRPELLRLGAIPASAERTRASHTGCDPTTLNRIYARTHAGKRAADYD